MSHTRAVFLMIFVTLLWSIAGVVTRHLDAAASFEVTFWRSFFNALSLLIALTILRGPALWRPIWQSPRIVWLSGLCWAIMFTAFMVALTLTTVANVLVTMAIGPMLTALMSRVFLQQHLPLRAWTAIIFAGLGIVWMFGMEASQGSSFTGSLIALAIPLAASINFVIMQHVSHDKNDAITHDMLPAILIGATLSALVSLPLAWPLQANTHDVSLLALLGVAQLALPCLLMVRLTKQLSATEISLLGLFEVLFGVTWAWLGAGESPSSNTLIGGALVLGALMVNELLALRERNADT